MRHLKPREIQGCQLALDASIPTSLYDATSGGSLVAADGAVARWEDQSGSGNHVTQSTSGNRPLRRVASRGGLDVLQENATTCNMQTASFYPSSGAADVTIISVALAKANAYSGVWQYGKEPLVLGDNGKRASWNPRYDSNKSAADFYSSYIGRSGSPPEISNWHVHAYICQSATTIAGTAQRVNAAYIVENYTLSGTSSLNIGTGLPFKLFNNKPNSAVCGYISFCATWPSALNSAVHARMEHATMRKWRING